VKGDLEICENGFHCSRNIIDAMGFVVMEVLARVEVRGKSIIKDDKECWEEMRLVKLYKWTKKDSVSLAIFAAELVLPNFEKKYPDDKRPREAIEAAKRVLKSDTANNRSAAMSAARSAGLAMSAAGSAMSARSARSARSAAWSAGAAAWSAAMSAGSAGSAESANYKEIMDKCHSFILQRTKINYDLKKH